MDGRRVTYTRGSYSSRLSSLAKQVGEGLVELVWPTRCIGCDAPGQLICPECMKNLPEICQSDACSRCGSPYGRVECTECWSHDGEVLHPFGSATCALEYGGIARKLVTYYKDYDERRLAGVMAGLLVDALVQRYGGLTRLREAFDCITYIPADKNAMLRRGFDHMHGVAAEMSDAMGVECENYLLKNDADDQRHLGKADRKENMEGVFELLYDEIALPGRILLVDDVFTTGSTLDAASNVLLQNGAEKVDVATICRVW